MSLSGYKRRAPSQVPPAAPGTYSACCVGVFDIGEQYTKGKGEQQGRYVPQVIFLFELIGETVEIDGEAKPRWVRAWLNASDHPKSNMYKLFAPWRSAEWLSGIFEGGGNSLEELAGEKCVVSVQIKKDETTGKEQNEITSIMSPPKGYAIQDPVVEILTFNLDDEWDAVTFAKIPEWIQRKIRKSNQYAMDPPEEVRHEDVAQPAAEPPEESKKGACPI